MTKWQYLDDAWSEDDPAVARLRAGLALQPPRPRETAQDASEPMPGVPTRRERVSALLARVRAGDLGAAGMLRDLLGERDE